MWKVAGLKVLGSLADGLMNAGGTHYRRSGIRGGASEKNF
jgi:hypothetical protein